MRTTVKLEDKEFNLYFLNGIMSVDQVGFYFSRSFSTQKEAIEQTIKYIKRKLESSK